MGSDTERATTSAPVSARAAATEAPTFRRPGFTLPRPARPSGATLQALLARSAAGDTAGQSGSYIVARHRPGSVGSGSG